MPRGAKWEEQMGGERREMEMKYGQHSVRAATVTPLVINGRQIMPKIVFWHTEEVTGYRAEILVSDDALGDIFISEFFETPEEAERAAQREMVKVAAKYVEA
jgi:hypothetical protein